MRRLIALLALVLLAGATVVSAPARADVGPKLYGKVASDGTLIAFWWLDIFGQYNGIQDGDFIQEDVLYVTTYAPTAGTGGNFTGSLNVTVYQYLERQVPVTYRVGNDTFTRMVTEQYDVSLVNLSIPVSRRAIVTVPITIPIEQSPHLAQVGYLDAIFRITHRTAPVIWPIGIVTRGGQLAFFLSSMILFGFVWSTGTGTAAAVHRRVRYWPRISRLGWTVGVMFLSGSTLFLLLYGWYEITGLDWWWWMVPLFVLSVLVMLNYLPTKAEPWFLVRFHGAPRDDELQFEGTRIVVAEDGQNGHILVHSRSVLKAVLRLFGGRTRVTFDEGPPAWYARNEKYEEGDLYVPKRLYILDPASPLEARFERLGWRPLFWKLKRPGIVDGECRVHLSGQYMRPVASWMAGYVALAVVAKEREDLRISAQKYKAQLHAGAITEHINDFEVLATELGITRGIVDRQTADERIEELKKARRPEPRATSVEKVEPAADSG